MADVRLVYDNGTVRVEGVEHLREAGLDDIEYLREAGLEDIEFDARSGTGRIPGFQYGPLRDRLGNLDIEVDDTVLESTIIDLSSSYQLREYQQDALDAWDEAGRRGVLELPTGSGKTVIGIAAMELVDVPTLVVVPTIDLLEQWEAELDREFSGPIGRLGGGKQQIEDVTVATYDSAYLRAEDIGNRFGLLVFDEVHHLGGEGYRDIARLCVAPARLGLTATFERPDDAHEVIETLLGPVVYRIDAETLAGEHLAPYDIKRIEVSLTPDERETYDRHQTKFTDYLARSSITLTSGSDYQKLVKRSGTDPKAREALLAKQRAREAMMNAERKVERLADLLDRHQDDRIIVFTAHTELVYRLSERFLIPAITHETGASERREILDRFREGEYSRVVTANVLDEGVDVPDANVAIVLSGSGSEREFTQRLGRILRPGADKRAILYELVTEETAEERVSQRRR